VEFTGVEGPILQKGGSRNGGVFHNGMFMQATPNMVDAGMEFTAAGISYRLGLVSGGPFTISGVGFRVLAEEVVVSTAILDTDGDSIPDDEDNCPEIANPDQADADDDGIGDACEPDGDEDGVADDNDNCVSTTNSDQQDTDLDGQGDACEADDDGDTVADIGDNCPLISNADQADFDSDSQGDACDADVDGDGANDAEDQCLGTAPGQVTDGAGCSVAQLCPCENPSGWKNHGEYVKCVAHTSEDFLDLGLITDAQKDAIVSKAGESQCGHKE
jgi:Thrombospondin type 3 repeat